MLFLMLKFRAPGYYRKCFRSISYTIFFKIKKNNNNSLSAIEVSFCYHEGIVDQSAITCPVTPLLYPLIKKIDEMYQCWEDFMFKDDTIIHISWHFACEKLLSSRDHLWRCLKGLSYNSNYLFWGFEETDFQVHLVWVNKSLDFFFRDKSFETSSTLVTQKQYLYFLIQRIYQSFYGTSTNLVSSSSSPYLS